MSAASFTLLAAPIYLFIHPRAAHIFHSLIQLSLGHSSYAEPTVRVGCRSTNRQRCFIFHYLRAGLSAWPEGKWFNRNG